MPCVFASEAASPRDRVGLADFRVTLLLRCRCTGRLKMNVHFELFVVVAEIVMGIGPPLPRRRRPSSRCSRRRSCPRRARTCRFPRGVRVRRGDPVPCGERPVAERPEPVHGAFFECREGDDLGRVRAGRARGVGRDGASTGAETFGSAVMTIGRGRRMRCDDGGEGERGWSLVELQPEVVLVIVFGLGSHAERAADLGESFAAAVQSTFP